MDRARSARRIAAYGTYRWRTSKPAFSPRALEPTVSEDLAATIGDAIDDLEAEPDARRAVIAAYARMEAVLGRNGLRRAPSETPLEYLRRILLGLTSRGDAVTPPDGSLPGGEVQQERDRRRR